jgi:hypothetical protein
MYMIRFIDPSVSIIVFIIAITNITQEGGGESALDEDMMEELSAHASVSSATRALRMRYGMYSPLMGVLGDFILAMLLHVSC